MQRRDTGRPEIAYGRRCPQDQIEHEVRVTDLALILSEHPFDRAAKVGRTEADAKTTYRGRECFIEVDNSGKMTAKQMKAKWSRYQGTDGFILVVAVKEDRMKRLCATAEMVGDRGLFTTFDRLRSGHPNPWVDWTGNTVEL